MIALLAAALLQSAGAAAPAPAAQPPDSTHRAAVRDSTRRARPGRIPLTAEHLRTAFDDEGARRLLDLARQARTRQDTALQSYDATTFQRISAGLGVRRFGRERLLYRQETATRVRWERGKGAVVDVLGSREASPEGGMGVTVKLGDDIGPIPYYPGQETLWLGTDVVQTEVDDHGPVHPLVQGAEAYYRYQTGDSVTVRLATGRTIRLRELRVRPRRPRWDLSVGSLWFDTDNAQLVRAVYRLAVPLEIWDIVEEEAQAEGDDEDDVPGWVKGLVNPLRATVSAVTVEYGLEGGGFWLPRMQAVEAEAEAGFLRVPVRFEQRFRYAGVNGRLDSLPPIPPPPTAEERLARAAADSAWRDTLRALPAAQRDSARRARAARDSADGGVYVNVGGGKPAPRRHAACDTATVRTSASTRFDGQLGVLVRVPCDTAALINSPALPGSIFAEGEALLDAKMQEALVDAALSLGAQAEWQPQPPTVKYGLGDGLLRYNRVEGLSPGVRVDAALGRGYTARALARIGTADWEPNGELALERSDGRRTIQASLYRRLAAANDWGEPLGLSSSLVALLFGRDEGLFYRSWGAEVTGVGRGQGFGGGDFSWRLFSERHDRADVETQFSFWNAVGDDRFIPNIAASEGSVTGMAARYVRTFGLDPNGVRLLADVRGEGGVGSFAFGRALADLTLSRPLVARVDGALTLSGGSSFGDVPVQRLFYLGGPFSVRGQDVGAGVGTAFWMARAELGTSDVAARPVLFYDLGWAGPREDWRHPGRPLSGAGAGLSFLDGLLRLDLSRGIWPERQWRLDAYFEARF